MWANEVVEKKPDELTLNFLIMGEPGTGKSYFAATLPDPIYVFDFDKGEAVYAALAKRYNKKIYLDQSMHNAEPIQKRILSIKNSAQQLAEGKHELGQFKTVVVDSLTTLAIMAMDYALALRPIQAGSPPVWNIHYPMVKVIVEDLIRALKSKGFNFVAISHISYEKNDVTGEILSQPSVTGNLRQSLPSLFDEVYIATPVAPKGQTEDPTYVLRIVPFGVYKARSRLRAIYPQLPTTIPNDWEQIKALINNK